MNDMKWVYAADRLPEEDGDYIVAIMWSVTDRREGATTYGERHTLCNIAISYFEYGKFSNELVYAWMPKPPLPPFPDETPEDAEPEEGANIIPIEEFPHKVSEVICVRCLKRWIAVRPEETQLKDMECPGCRMTGSLIETGEELQIC